MPTSTRPQRRLPARVYWTRRVLVLGTALLLVFGIARLLTGGGDEPTPEGRAEIVSSEPSETPDATTTPEDPEASATVEESPEPEETEEPEPPPPAEPSGPCKPSDITVKPTVKKQEADGKIEIPFQITGTEAACTWQVSNTSMVIRITSGRDAIWSSQECAEIPSKDLVVRSAEPVEIVFVWNGRRSDDNCSRTAKWALPGYYHVTAAALGGEPSDRQFELVAPSPEKVYETETPAPSASPSGAVEPDLESDD